MTKTVDELYRDFLDHYHREFDGFAYPLPPPDEAFKAGYEAGRPKWIPVSERLPEAVDADKDEEGWVLVAYQWRHLATGHLTKRVFIARRIIDDNSIWDVGDDAVDNHLITHWMPLPDKQEEE